MKLVIDIPKDIYEKACKTTMSLDGALPIYQSIKEGTPLPKGHGDLVDRDAIFHVYDRSDIEYTMIDALEDAPTVIEADYGEEEGDSE